MESRQCQDRSPHPISTRVQHVVSIIHRALRQSIERDQERTVNIMNLIVGDGQRWNCITPSWLVASCSMCEETSHVTEALFCEFGRAGDQSIEFNLAGSLFSKKKRVYSGTMSVTSCTQAHQTVLWERRNQRLVMQKKQFVPAALCQSQKQCGEVLLTWSI